MEISAFKCRKLGGPSFEIMQCHLTDLSLAAIIIIALKGVIFHTGMQKEEK